MKKRSVKTVIIGIDGVSKNRIMDYIRSGKMPVMEKLLSKSSCGALNSTILPITPRGLVGLLHGQESGQNGYLWVYPKKEGGLRMGLVLPFSSDIS